MREVRESMVNKFSVPSIKNSEKPDIDFMNKTFRNKEFLLKT